MCPKGKAMALHLTREYADGNIAGFTGEPNDNPYDFFDNYEEYYAWDIGWQSGRDSAKKI